MHDLPTISVRFVILAFATLALCSCQSTQDMPPPVVFHGKEPPPRPPVTVGDQDVVQASHSCPHCGPSQQPMSLPFSATHGVASEPWRPPGIEGPWPRDEYLCDGGDFDVPAGVRAEDWEVLGLEQEDTIAHAETVDGKMIIRPSNRVCIYAPRFNAVRHVDNAGAEKTYTALAGFDHPMRPSMNEERALVTTAVQPRQPVGQIGTKAASIYRERQQGGELELPVGPYGFHNSFLPFEDFQVIRVGIHDQAQKARLAEKVDAAITWTSDQAVQVVLEGNPAHQLTGVQTPEQVYRVGDDKTPELRIIKIASRKTAQVGETIDFTLRYDNTGTETIGNVTIVDNLSTRLEYVADSQQSNRESAFFTTPNEGGSAVLRWEITAPLEPGQGGILRFQALVR